MPASKTLPLERRITKLEQELAAYKRQLSKNAAGGAARDLNRQLIAIRKTIRAFFDAAEAFGIDWESDPGLARAAEQLANMAIDGCPRVGVCRVGVCRVCGCTDDDCSRCVENTGEPCHWIEPDLCSACAPTTQTPKPRTKRTSR